MEKESRTPPQKLTEVLHRQFGGESEILVSFPDKWEYVATVEQDQKRIYLAAFPIERAFNGREHFHGLGPEINVNLVFYRLYKFFQPWPMPQVNIELSPVQEEGRVTESLRGRLQMQPIGQAQAWFGLTHAVLWECYFDESRRFANWQDALADVWRSVEKDIGAKKLYTVPHEPAFPEGYREFLQRVGYAKDAEYPMWWSKKWRKGAGPKSDRLGLEID